MTEEEIDQNLPNLTEDERAIFADMARRMGFLEMINLLEDMVWFDELDYEWKKEHQKKLKGHRKEKL